MRLDQRLVAEGLAESRARAQALIKAGGVRVDGAIETKTSRTAAATAVITVDAERAGAAGLGAWVSRAGAKLAHALAVFDLSPEGAIVLDVGASTGGFTEVCLAAGARRVYALDVGRGQLHPRIASDPRVVEISGVNAREIDRERIPEPVNWVVADVSFIALAKALPRPLALTSKTARLVALVKPQFEVGRARIGKGGIVRDAAAQREAVDGVAAFLEGQGWSLDGETESPILGGDGNREFLLTARRAGAQ